MASLWHCFGRKSNCCNQAISSSNIMCVLSYIQPAKTDANRNVIPPKNAARNATASVKRAERILAIAIPRTTPIKKLHAMRNAANPEVMIIGAGPSGVYIHRCFNRCCSQALAQVYAVCSPSPRVCLKVLSPSLSTTSQGCYHTFSVRTC